MKKSLEVMVNEARHSGREVIAYTWVGLPVYKYEVDLLASGQTGPRDLDKVFFGLIQNGVASREEMSERLGIEQDSFVFAHLDILEREGYVVEKDGRYELSKLGKEFKRGDYLEESLLRKEKFTFFWDEVSEHETGDPGNAKIQKDGKEKVKRLSHQGGLGRDQLVMKVADSFNQEELQKQGKNYSPLEFYSIERWGVWKRHAKYAAIFYKSRTDSDDWEVELREMNHDNELELCRDLTETANAPKPWREQFCDILEKSK